MALTKWPGCSLDLSEDEEMTMELEHLLVSLDNSIRQAIACIDRNRRGIVLVVDGEQRLLGTITDGDVRRAMLAGVDLKAPVSALLARKLNSAYATPVTAPVGTEPEQLVQFMLERAVQQLPLLDEVGRVAGLVTLDELLPRETLPLSAVVMAGGYGTRLQPLTEDVPKPMLPVGERPLMERIIEQLRAAGIRHVSVTTHYKPETIVEHLGDGRRFGVQINYVNEVQPLGTAGALGLMETSKEPLLVINGDIVTQLNFRAMFDFHREHRADMTVGVRKYEFQVPYGVVEAEGVEISRLVEKPSLGFFINAGIYLLEPITHRYIPNGRRFDMTDLIECLLADGRKVVSFPIREYWLDIGQHTDYEQAQDDLRNGRICP
jgi:dTDP-glucose pyrophosphorylase/CBS domain-containing protein